MSSRAEPDPGDVPVRDRSVPRSGAITSIERAITTGVPEDAVAFFARWWQLETWLRQLVYMELRAKYGAAWLTHLAHQAPSRAARDEINKYMATPDASHVLAYLDVSHLFDLIASEEHWPLFKPSLPPRKRWDGMVDELRELRNRNAHCRRPHSDDLARIEQALRDLERGARLALETHNTRSEFTARMHDPIANGWIRKMHEDAARLVDHCDRQYDTQLYLSWSLRPWAEKPKDGVIAGQAGVFVHATFSMGGGVCYIEPTTLWRDYISRQQRLSQHLVFLIVDGPWSPSFTFSAVDGAEVVNDLIGCAFDDIIVGRTRGSPVSDDVRDDLDRWRARAEGLDVRVHIDSALAMAYTDQPFSVFEASSP